MRARDGDGDEDEDEDGEWKEGGKEWRTEEGGRGSE